MLCKRRGSEEAKMREVRGMLEHLQWACRSWPCTSLPNSVLSDFVLVLETGTGTSSYTAELANATNSISHPYSLSLNIYQVHVCRVLEEIAWLWLGVKWQYLQAVAECPTTVMGDSEMLPDHQPHPLKLWDKVVFKKQLDKGAPLRF